MDPTEDISDDSASDEDLKDLARHGLPSACIFVAKYVLTPYNSTGCFSASKSDVE